MCYTNLALRDGLGGQTEILINVLILYNRLTAGWAGVEATAGHGKSILRYRNVIAIFPQPSIDVALFLSFFGRGDEPGCRL